MSKKGKISIAAAIVIVVIGIAIYPKASLYMASRKDSINKESVEFFIKKNMDLNELAESLKSQGIIKETKKFIKVGEYKGLTKENIALGKYIIEPKTQYRTLLNGFTLNSGGNGNAEVEVEVTFNNCRFMDDMVGKVASKILVDSAEFSNYLKDPNVQAKYGFTKEQFPAMFLPNTYRMFYDTDMETFVDRMAKEFKNFWTAERKEKLKKIGLKSPSEAVTLASVVYSEQGRNPEEWPIIAGLYLNRINQGIKLQSDPTFKFCWGKELDGVQRLLNVHRDIDCAYNTYKINGLPPGPICIPPTQCVDAVLNRDQNSYIFMMAKPDYSGNHDFTIEYADHLRLATIYQKWLAKEIQNQ